MSKQVDTLIIHAHLFTMKGAGVGYVADGTVAVESSRIVAVGSTEELLSRVQATKTIDASDCAVLPGLIDAHMHTGWAIMRGVAQDVANWMQSALSPYWRHLTAEAAVASTRLNVVEALKAGTTTHGDYARPDPGWGEFFDEIGVRASLTPMFNALPPGKMADWKVGDLYPFDLKAGRRSMERAVAFAFAFAFAFACEWNGAAEGRITTMLGAHGPDMMPLEMLLEAKEIAQREALMLHTAQGDRETEQIVKRYGKRPIPFLAEIGYLDEQLGAMAKGQL